MPDGRKHRRNTVIHDNEARGENEKEKTIKHSSIAVHGDCTDAADGVCRRHKRSP